MMLRLTTTDRDERGVPEWLRVVHEANRVAGDKIFGTPLASGPWWAGGHFEEYEDARLVFDPDNTNVRMVARTAYGERVLRQVADNLDIHYPGKENNA